jgi:hypothetical protein
MLWALLQPVIDMRLTLADTIAVMQLIGAVYAVAHEELPYAFGQLPDCCSHERKRYEALPHAA